MNESSKGGLTRVALIQFHTTTDVNENLRKIEKKVCEAASNGAEFVMLPETVEYIGEDMKGNAFENPKELLDFYGELAKRFGIYLHSGSYTERMDEGKPRNTSAVFAPNGQQLASYSKVHLFVVDVTDGPCFHESDNIMAGNELVNVETSFGQLGMAICYDIRFPQMFHVMAAKGAEIFTVAANFTKPTGKAHWEVLLRARAIENCAYVLACNQCGKNIVCEAYGHSMVIDPWGNVIAQAEEDEIILYADLDLNEVNRVRQDMPVLKNCREEIYK